MTERIFEEEAEEEELNKYKRNQRKNATILS